MERRRQIVLIATAGVMTKAARHANIKIFFQGTFL
jgi:hypothetical protein